MDGTTEDSEQTPGQRDSGGYGTERRGLLGQLHDVKESKAVRLGHLGRMAVANREPKTLKEEACENGGEGRRAEDTNEETERGRAEGESDREHDRENTGIEDRLEDV